MARAINKLSTDSYQMQQFSLVVLPLIVVRAGVGLNTLLYCWSIKINSVVDKSAGCIITVLHIGNTCVIKTSGNESTFDFLMISSIWNSYETAILSWWNKLFKGDFPCCKITQKGQHSWRKLLVMHYTISRTCLKFKTFIHPTSLIASSTVFFPIQPSCWTS